MMPFLLHAVALRAPTPSASEIFRRMQKAYDSVRTFEQDVKGGIGDQQGTAHISFSRPGRLRASGNTLGGFSKYDLLCDGKSTWVLNGGSWSKVESPEMGVATITGVSGNAGTLVPAMLLHTTWGSLSPLLAKESTVVLQTVDGKKTFVIRGAKPYASITWIDAASFFVVRTETKVMDRTITVVFAPPKVDKAIPSSRFSR